MEAAREQVCQNKTTVLFLFAWISLVTSKTRLPLFQVKQPLLSRSVKGCNGVSI